MLSTAVSHNMPCLAFNHGGGGGNGVTNFLHEYISSLLHRPQGVIVVEAHLQSDPLIIAGDSDLANRVALQLDANGYQVALQLDEKHGREAHGVRDARSAVDEVDAQIPFVSLSLLPNEDAASHINLGSALAQLRRQGVLILGSGLPSFHNFDYWFSKSEATRREGVQHNHRFDAWLRRVIGDSQLSPNARLAALKSWKDEPSASVCHPPGGASHFMPLLVLAGVAEGSAGRAVFDDSHAKIMRPSAYKYSHFEFGFDETSQCTGKI